MSAIVTMRDCTHPRANHQHGTYLAFEKDGCRCVPCTLAYRKHNKLTAYRTATGTHSYTDAEPARRHVMQLLETLTVGQIEQRSGIDRTAIRVLVGDFPNRPATKRTKRKTERALLAVTAARVGSEQHGLVNGDGTVRRIQALMALGWCRVWLQSRVQMSSRTGWLLTRTPGPHLVTVSLRDRVRVIYDELAMTPPPPSRFASRTRNLTRAAGWAPPLAWDDETIDDPNERPHGGDVAGADGIDTIAVERVIAGEGWAPLSSDEVNAATALGIVRGLNYREIADLLHMTHDAVTQRVIRYSLSVAPVKSGVAA